MDESHASCVVVTYNTHRCLGGDGRTDPERIASVLAIFEPDIVALQELDHGMARSGMVDQAAVIAGALEMESHFHPSFHVEEGRYGNAILARHPMRLVKAGALPGVPRRGDLEPRGALWAEVQLPGTALQVLTTHLGLTAGEKAVQSDALLEEEWAGSPTFVPPGVVLGDLNDWGGSKVARKFRRHFLDTHRAATAKGGARTFPGRRPLLRLDYIFATQDVAVARSAAVRTPVTVIASDHLPVVAELVLQREVRRG